jgi:hypothetical protein
MPHIMRIYSNSAKETCALNQMKNSTPKRGGSREGAGRPSQGKTRINLTLNSDLVDRARAKESNLSALLDRLLTGWLAS